MIRPLVNKVRCKKCDDIIESRSTYDFKTCKCGTISIDGGKEYQKVSWKSDNPSEPSSDEDYIDYSYSVYEEY